MSAYLVVDLEITDAASFEVLEGHWKPQRLTLVEFPSAARAKDFYNSQDYQKIIGLRLKAAKTNLVLVEGV